MNEIKLVSKTFFDKYKFIECQIGTLYDFKNISFFLRYSNEEFGYKIYSKNNFSPLTDTISYSSFCGEEQKRKYIPIFQDSLIERLMRFYIGLRSSGLVINPNGIFIPITDATNSIFNTGNIQKGVYLKFEDDHSALTGSLKNDINIFVIDEAFP